MRLCDLPRQALTLPPPLVETAACGTQGARMDIVPEEVPVALAYNGITHAVMLASPADLADFGLGFSLSEGILQRADELFDLELASGEQGVVVQMRIAGDRFAGLKERRRTLAGRTGCGLCGVDSLDQVERPVPMLLPEPRIPATALRWALDQLHVRQPLHARTGGVHAAAWADPAGNLLLVREDVGRHNALDKMIGALVLAGRDPRDGFAVVTSRASFEMVQKSASLGIPMLAAVSAPTGYAIRLAQACGLTLAAFVRGTRYTLYAHPERIIGQTNDDATS
jgi:formate dehydrogenase accessory protein FdhD